MKTQILLVLLITIAEATASFAQIKIGIRQYTDGADPQNVRISYEAVSGYVAPPFNFWNSQVFTVRWPAAAGSGVINSLTNVTGSAFSFALDGGPVSGGDGFFYQKITSSATAVVQSIPMSATLDVVQLAVASPWVISGDFELVTFDPPTYTTSFVETIFGLASVNAAVGGDQFDGFATAVATDVPLPIELISFSGKYVDERVILEWTSASETDFSHYEIERSDDGEFFYQLGALAGTNNIRGSEYDFHDVWLTGNQIYYYRLRMVDRDGSYTYSDVIAISVPMDSEGELIVYPNPVTPNSKIEFHSPVEFSGLIRAIDGRGAIVDELKLQIQNGSNPIPLKLDQYPSGIYRVHLLEETGMRRWTSVVMNIK